MYVHCTCTRYTNVQCRKHMIIKSTACSIHCIYQSTLKGVRVQLCVVHDIAIYMIIYILYMQYVLIINRVCVRTSVITTYVLCVKSLPYCVVTLSNCCKHVWVQFNSLDSLYSDNTNAPATPNCTVTCTLWSWPWQYNVRVCHSIDFKLYNV